MSSSSGALEAIDRILNAGGDADDVLRAVVGVLHERLDARSVAISFREGETWLTGPVAGNDAEAAPMLVVPVRWEGSEIARLEVAGAEPDEAERNMLERVAVLISAHCLVGWDTGGQDWQP
jgi:hypothetical protein